MTVRGHVIETKVTVVVETCCSCGTPFGIEAELRRNLLRNHNWFHCPLGHSQQYAGESGEERLQRKLDEAQRNTNRLGSEINYLTASLSTAKAENKALKHRARAGVCSFCKRHFVNVERHMASKHKEA